MSVTFSRLGHLGRMGNSMFQIAAVIGYAEKHGQPFGFPAWEYQDYFANPLPSFPNEPVRVIQERSFSWHEPKAPFPHRNIDLYGYFQSEKYFKHAEATVRHYFKPKKEYEKSNFVSVHVRRGDYLGLSDYHNVLGMEYYNAACGMFSNCIFAVFSDDIPWCRENFKGDHFIFVDSGNDIDDFFIMASCAHHIIANSSYSWWAAWLSEMDGKRVIAPKKWFGPAAPHNPKDIYCENFTVI